MCSNVTEQEAESVTKENRGRQVVVSGRQRARWVYKIDWWLLLDFVAQSVEAIKSERAPEREL